MAAWIGGEGQREGGMDGCTSLSVCMSRGHIHSILRGFEAAPGQAAVTATARASARATTTLRSIDYCSISAAGPVFRIQDTGHKHELLTNNNECVGGGRSGERM